VKYLAPYIFRVAISNKRIERLSNGKVTFRYRKTDTGTLRSCTLRAEAFIHRFLQHVLPRGFVKVRYYGFLASGCRSQLAALRQQLGPLAADQFSDCETEREDASDVETDSSDNAVVLCPQCEQPMQRRKIHPGERHPRGGWPPWRAT